MTISTGDIQTSKFDYIYTGQVFEHIANPLDTLKYLSSALKCNGIIKISVPNGWDIKRRLKKMDWYAPKGSYNSLNAVAPLEHINCFNTKSLITMADLADLKKIKMRESSLLRKKISELSLKGIIKRIFALTIGLPSEKKSTSLYFSRAKVN